MKRDIWLFVLPVSVLMAILGQVFYFAIKGNANGVIVMMLVLVPLAMLYLRFGWRRL